MFFFPFFLFGATGQTDDWRAGHKEKCKVLRFAVGSAILVKGLVSAAALNGRKGEVISHQTENGRVMVRLPAAGGEPAREVGVKPANLERE